MSYNLPIKAYKTSIREVNLGDISIGGQNGLPFIASETKKKSKPLIAVEIMAYLPEKYSDLIKDSYGNKLDHPLEWAKLAVEKGADVLAVRFNIPDNLDVNEEVEKCKAILDEILVKLDIPVIVIGSDNKETDIKLLPALGMSAKRKCTIGLIEEDTYKEIIPALKDTEHNIIARTPIDINLAKELNILISDKGISPDRIIIDPNMGALGYGMDYAYSVIERIRIAALQGDNMLNMPIITSVGIEAWKAKESKTKHAPEEWGNYSERAIIWECTSAVSMLMAGADIVVLYHPESIKHINTFINRFCDLGEDNGINRSTDI